MFCPSMWPRSSRPCRNAFRRGASAAAETAARYPSREIFFGCCASAGTPRASRSAQIGSQEICLNMHCSGRLADGVGPRKKYFRVCPPDDFASAHPIHQKCARATLPRKCAKVTLPSRCRTDFSAVAFGLPLAYAERDHHPPPPRPRRGVQQAGSGTRGGPTALAPRARSRPRPRQSKPRQRRAVSQE
jgi:hypothetical protein